MKGVKIKTRVERLRKQPIDIPIRRQRLGHMGPPAKMGN